MKASSMLLLHALVYFSNAAIAQTDQRNYISNISLCGCQDCTRRVYNSMADGSTIKDRIINVIFEYGMTEEAACTRVSNEFPTISQACNPRRCDGRGPPVSVPIPAREPTFCACESCTQQVWNRLAGRYSCGARISYMRDVMGLSTQAACYQVSFHNRANCGSCNPRTCSSNPPPQAVISSAQAAPEVISSAQAAPEVRPQGNSAPERMPAEVVAAPVTTRCGCSSCTENIYLSDAGGHSCADRMDFLLAAYPRMYPTEESACRQIAGVEFTDSCGPQCDPNRCHGGGNGGTRRRRRGLSGQTQQVSSTLGRKPVAHVPIVIMLFLALLVIRRQWPSSSNDPSNHRLFSDPIQTQDEVNFSTEKIVDVAEGPVGAAVA